MDGEGAVGCGEEREDGGVERRWVGGVMVKGGKGGDAVEGGVGFGEKEDGRGLPRGGVRESRGEDVVSEEER